MGGCTNLVQIGDKIVDAQILREFFACDLSACKGACCLEGDSGAPVVEEEIIALDDALPQLRPMLTEEGQEAIDRQGVCYRDSDGDWVTTLVRGRECAFSFQSGGCYLCAIERAIEQGRCAASKPISCSLYPIRVGRSGQMTLLKYDRWEICAPAIRNGKKLGIRVYEFLKAPIVRAFGTAFYSALEEAAERIGESSCSRR